MSLGKRFASPIKGKQATAKRAKTRDSTKDLADLRALSPWLFSVLWTVLKLLRSLSLSYNNGCSHHAQGSHKQAL